MTTMGWKGIIEHYRSFLPVTDRTPVVTLGEGNTPLVRAERLPAVLGIEAEIYLKYEGLNPTGSFKDRGMTLAITKAVEEGARAVICASPVTPRPPPQRTQHGRGCEPMCLSRRERSRWVSWRRR